MTLTKQSWEDGEQNSSSAFTSPQSTREGSTPPELSPGWHHPQGSAGNSHIWGVLIAGISCFLLPPAPTTRCPLTGPRTSSVSSRLIPKEVPWACFPKVHVRHVHVVNKDGAASRQGVGKRRNQGRLIRKHGSHFLIPSFALRNKPKIWERMDYQAQTPVWCAI